MFRRSHCHGSPSKPLHSNSSVLKLKASPLKAIEAPRRRRRRCLNNLQWGFHAKHSAMHNAELCPASRMDFLFTIRKPRRNAASLKGSLQWTFSE
ncbi:hypothetical protein EVAR_95656_1 [Eumeta japonica]|uniref:Uncharacterized protein n=1 Tax=Eumeta variegata TaxID=151549 RepID=A0A4C1VKU0_EUMVA|nr:hypothetical protein EVAR_95656_1 [Eumeta japonica]